MLLGLLQLALVIHVLARSNAYGWFMPLMLARVLYYLSPLLSSIAVVAVLVAYLWREVLQGTFSVRTYSGWNSGFFKQRDIAHYQRELAISNSLDARLKLAKLLCEQHDYAQAHGIIRDQAVGIYADDPALLELLAASELGLAQPDNALQTLARLAASNRLSEDALLIKARALESLLRWGEAKATYESLLGRFSGLEVKARLARLCVQMNLTAEATQLARDIREAYRLAPAHVKRSQRPWLESIQDIGA